MSYEGPAPSGRGSIHLFTTLPRRTEPPDERSGEPTSPTATLSYYPLPPGTSAASLSAAAGDRMSYEGPAPSGRGSIHLFATLPRRTEPPDERSGEPTSPTATLSYYPLPPGTSAASLAAAAGDRMSSEGHFRGRAVRFISSRRCRAGQSRRMSDQESRLHPQPP
jgi:hypothetical protein